MSYVTKWELNYPFDDEVLNTFKIKTKNDWGILKISILVN